uniref:Uncharacterized protein n=1 Tax=Anguilla anguilla TaxID=7936 RepID=A0A0E9XDA0_ANGAN
MWTQGKLIILQYKTVLALLMGTQYGRRYTRSGERLRCLLVQFSFFF